jgi:aminopeptidase
MSESQQRGIHPCKTRGYRTAIHWDMVSIQREDYGGGEIYFDGELIRKNGRFVVPDLESLNPENLDISA